VTRNKKLLYTALTRSDIIVLETHDVQLLLIQRVLRGPTAEKAGMPISHRLFMSKVRRTQNGVPQLDAGLVMSRRVIMQPARKN